MRKNDNLKYKIELFTLYFERLKAIALNCIYFENLPETINVKYLERILLYRNSICFFQDDIGRILALDYNSSGLDVYGEPTNFYINAKNGLNFTTDKTNSVIMYNSFSDYCIVDVLNFYAEILSEIHLSLLKNVKQLKKPYIIKCDENTKLSFVNFMKDVTSDEELIFTNKNFDLTSLEVLNLNIQYNADKLESLKNTIWNEALTFLGVENSNQEKKERMVVEEVGGNYGNVEAQRNIILNARKDAIRKINKMFNLSIEVYFNSDLKTKVNVANVDELGGNEIG